MFNVVFRIINSMNPKIGGLHRKNETHECHEAQPNAIFERDNSQRTHYTHKLHTNIQTS